MGKKVETKVVYVAFGRTFATKAEAEAYAIEVISGKRCTECGGSGKLTRLGGDWGKHQDTEVTCWACDGTGVVK